MCPNGNNKQFQTQNVLKTFISLNIKQLIYRTHLKTNFIHDQLKIPRYVLKQVLKGSKKCTSEKQNNKNNKLNNV